MPANDVHGQRDIQFLPKLERTNTVHMGTVIVRGSSELVHCHVAGVTVYSSCCPRALGSVDLVCHVSDTD